jgi:hypothetical protein
VANQELVHQPNGAIIAPQTAREIVPAAEQVNAQLMESALVAGDLSKLQPTERMQYYRAVCDSLGLNPLTKPFEYLDLDGKLVLYTRKDATDQIASLRRVNRKVVSRELVDGVYIVTARASTPDGREDDAIGAVPLVKEGGEWKQAQSGKKYFQGNGVFSPLSPADRANAMMKCETKAKRRATLSLCGLGFVDESELDTMATARVISVDDAHTKLLARAEPPPVQTDPPPPQMQQPKPATVAAPRPAEQPKPAPSDSAVPADVRSLWARMSTLGGILSEIALLKKDIVEACGADAPYYAILAEFGIEHANKEAIKKLGGDTARQLGRRLFEYLQKVTAEPPLETAKADLAQVMSDMQTDRAEGWMEGMSNDIDAKFEGATA